MSNNFITQKQLIEITHYRGSEVIPSDTFATRRVCETAGADSNMLLGYGMDQYPVDYDIEKSPFEFGPFTTTLEVKRSFGLSAYFYPVDSFRISFSVVPGSMGYNQGSIFQIYGEGSVACISCEGYTNVNALYLNVVNSLGQVTAIQIGKNLSNNSIAAVNIMYTPTRVLSVRVNNVSIYSEKFEFDPNYSYYAIGTGATVNGGSLDNFTISW